MDIKKKQDSFIKICNYSELELFNEVFALQGFDYDKFEKSVFKQVKELEPNFKNLPILDIGIGNGRTSESFILAGCKGVTGIDVNQEMLDVVRKKFGASIKLFLMDATKLNFKKGDFPIIISGAAIHNIPKKNRKNFWEEILRLSPRIFVNAEKVVDSDLEKHKLYLHNEIEAIKKIYVEKYNLPEVGKEWLDHYEYDEQERLELKEIEDSIGSKYNISIVLEMGLYKTIVATIK